VISYKPPLEAYPKPVLCVLQDRLQPSTKQNGQPQGLLRRCHWRCVAWQLQRLHGSLEADRSAELVVPRVSLPVAGKAAGRIVFELFADVTVSTKRMLRSFIDAAGCTRFRLSQHCTRPKCK
jgi:hypothetical protein